jgi:hypothetical protein
MPMLQLIGKVSNRVADYTIGTVIVMVHIAMADRKAMPALPDPRRIRAVA